MPKLSFWLSIYSVTKVFSFSGAMLTENKVEIV